MTMSRIEFRQGERAAAIDVDGQLLPIDFPHGVHGHRVRRDGPLEWVVLEASDDVALAGRIAVPYIDKRHRISMAYLDVPPPPPWTRADLKRMWDSAARLLPEHLRKADMGTAPWGQGEWRRSPERLAWERFDQCRSAAEALLVNWPTHEDESVAWIPFELSFGEELSMETDLGIGTDAQPIALEGGRLVPDRSARRIITERPAQSLSIYSAATLVSRLAIQLAERSPVGTIRADLLRPLIAVRRQARPGARAPDPPPSSWPLRFRQFYSSALGAVTHLASVGRAGDEWAPLSDVWWLYEAWVTERISVCLERILGRPDAEMHGDPRTLIGCWTGANEVVELHHQVRFPTGDKQVVHLAGEDWKSVTSLLAPDVVLLVKSGDWCKMVVVDPKEWKHLRIGDVSTEASKYLWGIRRASMPERPGAVERAILVAPVSGPDLVDVANGRAEAIHAAPYAPPEQLPGELGQDLSTGIVKSWLDIARGLRRD